MTELEIARVLNKHGLEIDHWMSFYKMFGDDIWFTPNNQSDEAFTVANHMHEYGLLQKMIIPKWNNGSFIGFKIQFKKLS